MFGRNAPPDGAAARLPTAVCHCDVSALHRVGGCPDGGAEADPVRRAIRARSGGGTGGVAGPPAVDVARHGGAPFLSLATLDVAPSTSSVTLWLCAMARADASAACGAADGARGWPRGAPANTAGGADCCGPCGATAAPTYRPTTGLLVARIDACSV